MQKENLETYTKYRELIIKNLGVLKSNTRDGKRAEKMMIETMDENGYYTNDNKINKAKYYGDCRENEAIQAQTALEYRVLSAQGQKQCFIKDVKQSVENTVKNFEQLGINPDEFKSTITEKHKSIKDFISYLFD